MVEAPASEKQREYLANLGVDKVPDGLTKFAASLWIEELKEMRDKGTAAFRSNIYLVPPTPAQRQEQINQEFQPAAQLKSEPKPVAEPPAPVKPAPAAPAPQPPTTIELSDMSPEKVRLLKSLGRFPDNASPDEVAFGLQVAQRLGLDPFKKQIRFIRFREGDPIDPFVTIDGLYAIAARSGQWAGIDLPQWEVDPNHPEMPLSASCTVYRMIQGARYPFSAIARFNEFVKRRKDGEINRTWSEMPYQMIGKVAKAQALRMAFPEELAGVYEESEGPLDGGA